MYLLEVLVKLPLHGSHCRFRISGQPRSANRKVFVATGALAVQPRFVVLGDLKMWLFHASSFPQSRVPYQPRWISNCTTTTSGCARMTGNFDAIFVFAMSAE